MATNEYDALIVDKVEAKDLLQAVQVEQLPVERVKIPLDDLSKVAVVSWRRDSPLSPQPLPSRNLACAVLQAKKTGVRHLFIDIVSVNQQLPGDELMQQVLMFSVLYKTLPVIAAYDEINEDWKISS